VFQDKGKDVRGERESDMGSVNGLDKDGIFED
jgi:hypothetical protein